MINRSNLSLFRHLTHITHAMNRCVVCNDKYFSDKQKYEARSIQRNKKMQVKP